MFCCGAVHHYECSLAKTSLTVTFDVDEKEIDVEVLLWFHPVVHINTYFIPQVHKYSPHFQGVASLAISHVSFEF